MPIAERGNRRIHYRDSGSGGPAVVLVHGFPVHSGLWRPQEEALGSRCRLLLPDVMGFGDSDPPEDPSIYSVEAFADDVAGVMDHAGVDRAVVGGLSMGGYVTFAVWRSMRDRITALVLADTRAEADTEEGRAKRAKQQERLRADGTAGLIEDFPAALLSDITMSQKPDVVAEVRALMDNPAPAWIGALEALKKRPDSTDLLDSIDVPTLILVGERDAVTPPELSRSMHERIGGSRLVVVPDAGHFSNLESPGHFSGALAEFLEEHDFPST